MTVDELLESAGDSMGDTVTVSGVVTADEPREVYVARDNESYRNFAGSVHLSYPKLYLKIIKAGILPRVPIGLLYSAVVRGKVSAPCVEEAALSLTEIEYLRIRNVVVLGKGERKK